MGELMVLEHKMARFETLRAERLKMITQNLSLDPENNVKIT